MTSQKQSEFNVSVAAFEAAFKKKKERNHEKLFVLVDVHDTFLKPNYEGVSSEFYPFSKIALALLSKREDVVLIMWTCSKKEDCKIYHKLCADNGINFDYINENPEVQGKLELGDYDAKMYCSVLLDDKANPFVKDEWFGLCDYLMTFGK